MVVQPLGDCAYAVTLEGADSSRAAALAEALRREPRPGQTEVVAAYATVAVYFRREAIPTALELEHHLVSEWGRLAVPAGDATRPAPREIPVIYGGEVGPDLPEVATHARLSVTDVVRLHAGADYQVEAIGFLPGFPYLSGLAPELACPRRPVPRTAVPAGSVGIGGAQTGVYPCASPGGWNLIGRTPMRLFDPQAAHPAVLRAGDRVRFTPAAAADFRLPKLFGLLRADSRFTCSAPVRSPPCRIWAGQAGAPRAWVPEGPPTRWPRGWRMPSWETPRTPRVLSSPFRVRSCVLNAKPGWRSAGAISPGCPVGFLFV